MILELMLPVGEFVCYSQVKFFSLLAQVRMRGILLGMDEVSKMSVVWSKCLSIILANFWK